MDHRTLWQRPVTNPHLLTPKALKIAQGKHVNHVSVEDWNSYADYAIRVEIVDDIIERLQKSKLWKLSM